MACTSRPSTIAFCMGPTPQQGCVYIITHCERNVLSQRYRLALQEKSGQESGGVRDVDQVVCICADEGAQRGAGLGHQALEAAAEELDGLAFELPLLALVGLEDGAGQAPKDPWLRKRFRKKGFYLLTNPEICAIM